MPSAAATAAASRFALRHRFAVLVLFFVVLGGTTQMFRVVPKGFIPDQDDDSINIGLRAAQGTAVRGDVDERAAGRQPGAHATRTCSAPSPFSATARAAPAR